MRVRADDAAKGRVGHADIRGCDQRWFANGDHVLAPVVRHLERESGAFSIDRLRDLCALSVGLVPDVVGSTCANTDKSMNEVSITVPAISQAAADAWRMLVEHGILIALACVRRLASSWFRDSVANSAAQMKPSAK